MYRNLWKLNHGAICSIRFFNTYGIALKKVIGFKVDKYLVTDQSVFNIKKADEVELIFVEEDGYTTKASLRIPYERFIERTVVGTKNGSKGIGLINMNHPEFNGVPSLNLCLQHTPEIGQPIAVMGFQADKDNLAIHKGIISSYFKKGGNTLIQVDANIQFGNSGSPLINPETNEVVGIIGHRLSEINKVYENLMNIINKNIAQLKSEEGQVTIGDLDPVQAVLAGQNQIKHLTKELYKSSIQRIGSAYQIGHLISYFKSNIEAEKKTLSLKVRLEE